jgi:hypothetical protein
MIGFSLFDEDIDFAVHKTAVKYSSVINTLKSDLFNLNKENVCLQFYVIAKTHNVFISRS